MASNYPLYKTLGVMCASAAKGNLGGVLKSWQYIPKDKHPQGLEALLLSSLIHGAPKSLEALMTVHGRHPEVQIHSSGYFTYIPSSDNGIKQTIEFDKKTILYKSPTGISLVSPDAVSSLEQYGKDHPEVVSNLDIDYKPGFKQVYGDVTDKLEQNLAALHPHIKNTILQFGYGFLLGRKLLDIHTAEFCAVCTLIVSGSATQLYSHMRGSLLNGAKSEELEDIIETLYNNGDASLKKYELAKKVVKLVIKSTHNINSKL